MKLKSVPLLPISPAVETKTQQLEPLILGRLYNGYCSG
jgi:hypothetical protein